MSPILGSGRGLCRRSKEIGIPSQILEFLQSGLNKGPGPGTLKVQVSALSAKPGTRWILHHLVTQSLKACVYSGPPWKPPFPTWISQ